MNLQEVKLVLDWTKQKLDRINGAKLSNPDEYKKWRDYNEFVGDVYDEMCEKIRTRMNKEGLDPETLRTE